MSGQFGDVLERASDAAHDVAQLHISEFRASWEPNGGLWSTNITPRRRPTTESQGGVRTLQTSLGFY